MSIRDVILEQTPGHYSADDLDSIETGAQERTHYEAESATIYYSHALDILSELGDPDPSDVAEYLGKDDMGDWRKVMTISAYVVKRVALEAEVQQDLATLREAIEALEAEGHEPGSITTDTALGFLPHESETDMDGGVLYYWRRPEGGEDRYLLRVTLSDGDVWIDAPKALAEVK